MKAINIYLRRQRDQIRVGDWLELRRKLKSVFPAIIRLLLWLLKLPIASLIVLVVRLIRPYCIVRFQKLISWRIGHFAANTELYLCERDVGINVPESTFVDIWYHSTNFYNKQLGRMWGRVLNIGPRHLLEIVARLNSIIPGGDLHQSGSNTQGDRDVHNLLDHSLPHLRFLPKEEKQGEAGLRALDIPVGTPFVCLNVRDPAYLSDQNSRLNAKVDWSYHDYRDCNVQNYILAAQELANCGYYVIRMGAAVRKAMNVVHPMIIDYAASGMRNDFMDIYLGAKCKFCISNGTGFDAVPFIFRRPIVYVDHVPLGIISTYSSKFLATTKKHWLRGEGRFMTFREIFSSGSGYFLRSEKYEDLGIDLIESTPEEIAAVVHEMEARLNGSWQPHEDDEDLQRKFWEIFPTGAVDARRGQPLHGEIRSRIGAEFLRKNRAWLI